MLGKTELLNEIAGKNRGLLVSELDKKMILSAVAKLEDLNPTPRPTEAPELLDGDWRLLYTTSGGLLGLDRLPLVKLGQIYQCIRVADARVYNIAEVYGLPYLEGLVSVCAKFSAVSERRVTVKFDRSVVGLQRWVGYQSPQALIQKFETGEKLMALDNPILDREQRGWLDITYLDQDLRIGRGNEGSIFVLTKS